LANKASANKAKANTTKANKADPVEAFAVKASGLVFDVCAAGDPDGPAALFLHGFPQTSRCWRRQMEALAASGRRAVAFDQRGYSPGARPMTVSDYAVPLLVGDVLGVADGLGIERFDLVGHDWGGAVAWQVAGRHPQRLRTLTVVSTPHPAAFTAALRAPEGDQATRSSYMLFFRQEGVAEDALLGSDCAGLRGIFAMTGLPAEDAEPYVAALREPGALTAVLNWYRAASIGDVEGMGPVTAPTLYVWSTDDPALGRQAAEATAAHVSGPYRFCVLEGVSHWVPEQAADELNRLLLEHLSEAGTRSVS